MDSHEEAKLAYYPTRNMEATQEHHDREELQQIKEVRIKGIKRLK